MGSQLRTHFPPGDQPLGGYKHREIWTAQAQDQITGAHVGLSVARKGVGVNYPKALISVSYCSTCRVPNYTSVSTRSSWIKPADGLSRRGATVHKPWRPARPHEEWFTGVDGVRPPRRARRRGIKRSTSGCKRLARDVKWAGLRPQCHGESTERNPVVAPQRVPKQVGHLESPSNGRR